MNNEADFLPDPHEYELVQRAEELLERFFEKTITKNEAGELRSIWDRLPQLLAEAREHAMIEGLFDLSEKFQATLSEEQLDRLDRRCVGLVDVSEKEPIGFDTDLDFKNLIRLVAESKPIPPGAGEDFPMPASETIEPVPLKGRPKEKFRFYHGLLIMIVLFGFGLAVYSEFFMRRSENTPLENFRPIARVDAVLDAVWEDEGPQLKEGQQLESEHIVLRRGIVQLVMNGGVRVAVEGPAEVRLNTKEKIFCAQGRLSATIPPEAKGAAFEVVTPFLSVVDLGTKFYVDVDSKRIETHVVQGKVELSRLTHENIPLAAGRAFEFDAAGIAKHFDAEPNRFLTDLFVSAMQERRDVEVFDRWMKERDETLEIPGIRLFYDFEDGEAADRVGGAEGRILGAKPCQGRWKGKQAISFNRRNDAVAFEFAPALRSMTLVASIRPDTLRRNTQVVLGSRGMEVGNFLWQIFSDGSIQLAVRPEKDVPYDLYRTKPVLTPRRLGAWYQLATVVDGENRTVRFYLDGETVGEFPLKASISFRLGDATLGNHLPDKRTSTDSSFDGRIDQFMIFDRPLTAEQLAFPKETLP